MKKVERAEYVFAPANLVHEARKPVMASTTRVCFYLVVSNLLASDIDKVRSCQLGPEPVLTSAPFRFILVQNRQVCDPSSVLRRTYCDNVIVFIDLGRARPGYRNGTSPRTMTRRTSSRERSTGWWHRGIRRTSPTLSRYC